MKRSQASSESPVSEKKSNKKAKISAPNETADESAGWTKVEKRKQKKAQKQEVKLDATQPRFMYANSEIVKRNHAIGIDDVRDLILHLTADGIVSNPKSSDPSDPGSDARTAVSSPAPDVRHRQPNLPLTIPLPDPGRTSDFAVHRVDHPERVLPGPHQLCGIEEAVTQRDNSQHGRERLPCPVVYGRRVREAAGWIETPAEQKPSLLDESALKPPKKMVYSIDCEMCLTEDGKELTRICIIDFYSGAVVYDQLVKPAKPILDYLTRHTSCVSSLRPPATRSRPAARACPVPHADPHRHSLESDLKALKLCHPLCIDTAVLYHHPRAAAQAWARVAHEEVVRARDPDGRKMDAGPGFGEFKTDYESIFERMARTTKRTAHHKSAVVDLGNPAVMHGSKATTAIGCKDDDEVLKGLLEVVPSHDFVFGRFMALAETLGWTTPKPEAGCPIPELAPPPSPEVLAYALMPRYHRATALVVFTGHSDPRRMALLNARKTAVRDGDQERTGPLRSWVQTCAGRRATDETWRRLSR
ncbi:hypothetical protein B0H10DRAFT_2219348 [Mycena sp. CBHHK59/15]|nr:hypothetical protein B0H10DRAFT_2219348 [Mycena sp. CBHHK59/15]